MAIQFYTGTGGVHAMFRKLAEVWEFKQIIGENGADFENPQDSGIFQLWLTEEVYIRYSASDGWTDGCMPTGLCNPFLIKAGVTPDDRPWKIVKTESGIAFGIGTNDVSAFIGRTVAYDGTQSYGIIARSTSVSYTYVRITDGMTAVQDTVDIHPTGSVHYTQLSNVVPASVPVYFPDIYQVCASPQTTNRVAQIGADVFYCTQRIAIRDTAAATGSVDLSGYYNAAQTDAKIKAVETVLSEEIAAVSETVQAAQTAADEAMSAAGNAQSTADKAVSDAATAQSTADAAQTAADEAMSAADTAAELITGMNRTVRASTEAEVREALQFAAEHPGCYLSLTLAAGLHATVPTLYIRNAVVYIAGTQTNGVNTSTITFEQTNTTSNLHVQNTSLSIQNINLNGCHKNSTAGYGVVRVEQGSSLQCSGVKFGQAEGSQNFGNNIEVQVCSRALIANTEFCVLSSDTRASGIFVFGNSEAVSKSCTMSADSAVQNIARLEVGSSYNQIGSSYGVYMPAGHASMYLVNGVQSSNEEAT